MEKQRQQKNYKLLLADDNPLAAQILRLQLSKLGHEVTLVHDGQEAVEAASGGDYDAVIMDCQMPTMDGLEATQKLRELYDSQELPIIGVSANHSLAERACQAVGMNDYRIKPVLGSEVHRLLTVWLRGKAS